MMKSMVDQVVDVLNEKGDKVWDKPMPEKEKEGKLTPAQKAKAKARAAKAGRKYPNMVDNMWASNEEVEVCCDECEHMAEGLEHEDILIIEDGEKKNVTLNKPQRGGSKKFYVYVKNDKGNVVKVSFGDPNMEIKRDDPARRKSFRARHNCDNPGPKWKARYWSCRQWRAGSAVED